MSIDIETAHLITEKSIRFVGEIGANENIHEDDPMIRLKIPNSKIPNLQDTLANSNEHGAPSEGPFFLDFRFLDGIDEDSTFFEVREIVRADTVERQKGLQQATEAVSKGGKAKKGKKGKKTPNP